jgi:predicted Zn-dependent protease
VVIDRLRTWWTLRSLRTIERQDARDHYWDFKNLMTEARDNQELGNRTRALEIWNMARARFPELAMQSDAALNFLLTAKRYGEAEDLMNAGIRHYPNDMVYLEGLATIALERRDWEECLRRCDTIQGKHPRSWKRYSIAATALSELGRSAEAESMLSKAMRILPEDIGLQIEHARLAQRRHDWDSALARWIHVSKIFLDPIGIVGAAHCLKELGRYEEAEGLIADVLYRAGNNQTVWIEHAAIAEHQNHWDDASERWDAMRRRFPLSSIGYTHGLRALLELGQIVRAEEILQEGMRQIPDNPALLIAYADLAHNRRDWTKAVERWASLRARFPEQREGYEKGAVALEAVGLVAEALELRSTMAKPQKAI